MKKLIALFVLLNFIFLPVEFALAIPDGTGSDIVPIGTDVGDRFDVRAGGAGTEIFSVEGNLLSVGIGETTPGAKLEVDTDDTNNLVAFIVDQDDTTNNNVALQVENAGTGNGVFVNQDGNGISLNVDSESTTADIVNLDGSTLTSGNLVSATLADSFANGTAMINITGTALNTAAGVIVNQLSTTAVNDVDVTAIHIEQGANDPRIIYDEGDNEWKLDQGQGAGAVAIATGASGGNTLDQAYDQGGAGAGRTINATDGAVAITVADTSNNQGLVVTQNDTTNNPSGLELVNTGTGNGLFINQDGNGSALSIDSESTSAVVLDIPGSATTTGNVLSVAGANALTSGSVALLASDSADITARTVVQVTNDNAAATGATALGVQQDAAQNAFFLDQNADGITLNIDAESTSADIFNIDAATTSGLIFDVNSSALDTGTVIDIDGSALTTGAFLTGTVDDTLNADQALFDITGTALNSDTRIMQLSLTDGGGADIDAVYIDRDTADARIFYDDANERWQLDQGDGSGLVNIATSSAGGALSALTAAVATNTLANANFAQVWNWDTLTTETAMQFGSTSITSGTLVSASSTATAMTGTLVDAVLSGNNAANTGTVVKSTVSGASSAAVPLMATNAGTGASFRVNDDGTDTDTTAFLIDASGQVIVGGTTANTTFEVNGGVTYTPSATAAIVAGTGITVTDTDMRIQGSGGAVDITADPQVADGADGQIVILQGDSDANTVKLDDGTGLQLSGGISFTMGKGDTLKLVFDSGDDLWIELARSDN